MNSPLLFPVLYCLIIGLISTTSSFDCGAHNHVLNCSASKTEADQQVSATQLHRIVTDSIGNSTVLGNDDDVCDDPTAPTYIQSIASSALAVLRNMHNLEWRLCGQAFNISSSTSPLQAFHQLADVKLMTPQDGIHPCVFWPVPSLRNLTINCKSNLPSHLSVSKDIQMVRLVYCTDVPIQVNCRRCVDNSRGENIQIVLRFHDGPPQRQSNVILSMQQDCSTDKKDEVWENCQKEEICIMDMKGEATGELPMEVPPEVTTLSSIAIGSQIHNGSTPAPSSLSSSLSWLIPVIVLVIGVVFVVVVVVVVVVVRRRCRAS